ncbi:unnamed protein product, partial [marine sediment metagenome]
HSFDKTKNQFVAQTKLRHYYIDDNHSNFLNKRELECLLHTLQGYTANETANCLNISPKTVEGYISEVKTKLGCNKRSALFKKAMELKLVKVADLL